MKIYISGPISKQKIEKVRNKFDKAEQKLISEGNEVINPLKINHLEGALWKDYMLRDIEELFKCDAIYMMEGWENSMGARIELSIAIECCLRIFYEEKPVCPCCKSIDDAYHTLALSCGRCSKTIEIF